MSEHLGTILSWDTRGCIAERSAAITTYRATKLHTYVPKFPQVGQRNVIEQMVTEGRLLPIGQTDERQSFAIVEENKDPDRVDWHGTLTDAVTLFNTGEVVVRNNPDLEERIKGALEQAEAYMMGPEIGRVICNTFETDAHAVRIRQGVVWVPSYEWSTLCKIEDIWCELCDSLQFFEFDLGDSQSNKEHITALAKNSLDQRLNILEVHVMRDLMRERVNPPNRLGVGTKYRRLETLEYQAKMYGDEIGHNLSQDFEYRFGNCRKSIDKLQKEIDEHGSFNAIRIPSEDEAETPAD